MNFPESSQRSTILSQLETLLSAPPFASPPQVHHANLLGVLRAQLAYASERNPLFRAYLAAWPVDYRRAERIADLPYVPVGAFKSNPPLALVPQDQWVRTLASSATTGQTPSRIALDAETSRRMTRGLAIVLRDFIGPQRRPFLVIDTAASLSGSFEMGARSAAIQGLRPFATESVCCLADDGAGGFELEPAALTEFAARFADAEVLAYGFTYVIWQHFVRPLRARGLALRLPKLTLLHSGGWKRLQELAVRRDEFASGVAAALGCEPQRIVDFYGMVENVGVVYPDCPYGNKHVPAFAAVLIRDPLTLEPVAAGQSGMVQVCSALPTSFPGFAVLTDDIGEVVCYDGCACGRRGIAFRFVKRVPKVELRGCGNLETARHREGGSSQRGAGRP